jgi:adenine-specific DNA-methyltransferase
MASWAIRSHRDRVLDPAAGEAVFLTAAAARLRTLGGDATYAQLIGVEIEPAARLRALDLLDRTGCPCDIRLSDFFLVRREDFRQQFDVVIGNPPYVRYHRFRGETRQRALEVAKGSGVRLTGLASSWAPFVVHASHFLAPGGRLALVLPAELLHVDYAGPIREFLMRRFASVTVVTFERAIFPGAMIDAILLLAEDGPVKRGLEVQTLADAADLQLASEGSFVASPAGRWSRLRSPSKGADALEQITAAGQAVPLSQVASVDIGCVTGANDFFILTGEQAKTLKVSPRSLQPIVSRPAQLAGAIARRSDFNELFAHERSLLLRLSRPKLDAGKSLLSAYLRRGRRLGISQRYKCQIRDPWYSVPGIHVPHAFLSYMSHRIPRIALNRANVSSTNLVHQLTFRKPQPRLRAAYIASLYSSLSLLSFELEGRSYGGGVLKLETREAERVLVPELTSSLADSLCKALEEVDVAVRSRDSERAINVVDECFVRAGLLDSRILTELRSARAALQERRSLRGRTSAKWQSTTLF